MSADLQNPIFNDLDKAREALEAARWPNGPICPKCGSVERQARVAGEKHRPGLVYCNECKATYTVTVGTVFERSKVPLTKWWLATHLLTSSKKGISAHQIHRMLGVTYKTAWFMCHRIREAMAPHPHAKDPMGGPGLTVEIDETYVGGKDRNKHANKRKNRPGKDGKEAVFSLVERHGKVRSHHVPDVSARTLRPILAKQIQSGSKIMSDEGGTVRKFAHATVNHSIGEYVRGDAHTNTIESYFAIMKRGITGVYHHVSQQHLKRYLAEFDFRYNERTALGVDDAARAMAAMKGIEGKRLTYRRTNGAS